MEDDPFGVFDKQCRPISSQEDVLQTCPFARQSKLLSDGDDDLSPFPSPSPVEPTETPVEPTGITIISLPDSSMDDSTPHDDEDFQTPPEDSLLASSEEQQRQQPIEAVDYPPAHQINGGDGMQSVPIDEAVDLGMDSDNRGFSGAKLTRKIDGGDRVSEFGFKTFENSQSEPCESGVKRVKTSEKVVGLEKSDDIIGNNEPMMVETDYNENADSEAVELESEKNGEVLLGLSEDKVFVEIPPRETNELCKNGKSGSSRKSIDELDKFRYVSPSGANVNRCGEKDEDGVIGNRELGKIGENSSSRKNIDDLDKFRYVGSSGVNVMGKRELPASIIGESRSVKEEKRSKNLPGNGQPFKDLLDAYKMVVGKSDRVSEDVDFLEIAKRRGLNLPRPRWWPPE